MLPSDSSVQKVMNVLREAPLENYETVVDLSEKTKNSHIRLDIMIHFQLVLLTLQVFEKFVNGHVTQEDIKTAVSEWEAITTSTSSGYTRKQYVYKKENMKALREHLMKYLDHADIHQEVLEDISPPLPEINEKGKLVINAGQKYLTEMEKDQPAKPPATPPANPPATKSNSNAQEISPAKQAKTQPTTSSKTVSKAPTPPRSPPAQSKNKPTTKPTAKPTPARTQPARNAKGRACDVNIIHTKLPENPKSKAYLWELVYPGVTETKSGHPFVPFFGNKFVHLSKEQVEMYFSHDTLHKMCDIYNIQPPTGPRWNIYLKLEEHYKKLVRLCFLQCEDKDAEDIGDHEFRRRTQCGVKYDQHQLWTDYGGLNKIQ